MNKVFTIYSVFYLITCFVSFFVAFLALQRKSVKGAKELFWLMIASGIGAFWIIFETSAPTISEKIFWAKLEYIGGVATPVLFLIFVLRFNGKDKLISKRNILLLFTIPAVTLLLTFFNEKHNLIWTGFSEISKETNLMEYFHGVWFWIGYIGYSYIMLLLATIYLVNFLITQTRQFRLQGWIVLAGGLFPWIMSIFYLTGKNPVSGLDLTPASITLSGVMAGYAILYYNFLDLVPVARGLLVETLSDGILALDGQNRIQDINSAAKTFLGITKKNIVGLPVCSSDATATRLQNAVIDNEEYEKIEIRSENEIKTFSIIKQPVKNQPESRLVIIRDISARIRAEEQLIKARELAEESDRLKSAFLANMSHEIRTPMNGILGFTHLLSEQTLTDADRSEYLDIISKCGNRLVNIINDIIDISKVESGQMEVSYSLTNINEQFETIYSFFKPEAEAKGVSLSFSNSLTSAESDIKTDSEKLSAVLTNLVKNSIKFTLSGSIEFGCRLRDEFLEFFVKDTGIGIEASQSEIIFERFRQGAESLTRQFEGTGLGLSISKAYVEMLNGKIWFESDHGKETTFYFTIPYNNAKRSGTLSAKPVHEGSEDKIRKNLVVILAEDDEPSAEYITKIIRPFCKKIIRAKTGIEVVQTCRDNKDSDLVLMDLRMPGMDGLEATQQIRDFNKDIIIIAQTAFGFTDDKEKAIEAGCNDYISKPLDHNLLTKKLLTYFG